MLRPAKGIERLNPSPPDAALQPEGTHPKLRAGAEPWRVAHGARLAAGSSNTVSQIITATIELGLVKNDPNAPDSRRYARYIPAWA